MKQRLGLSLLGGVLALSIASAGAMAFPADNEAARDQTIPPASEVTPARWHGGFSFGFYPGYYGYYGGYRPYYYRPYYYRPYYYDYYYYPYYRRHHHHRRYYRYGY